MEWQCLRRPTKDGALQIRSAPSLFESIGTVAGILLSKVRWQCEQPIRVTQADKSTIVDEAVNYIKTLQNILQKLQKQRLKWMQRSSTINYDASMVVPPTTMSKSKEAYFVDQASASNWATMSLHDGLLIPCKLQCLQTWSSPNVVLSVSGDDAQISICIARKPGLLPIVFYILEKYKIDVITATISSDHFKSMLMIHTRASGVFDQYPEVASAVEEKYKRAVGEMIKSLSS
ncbi:hypothetical protein MRB53_016318 [Persea americana]|uniref:Uncharacterized protein n=1 Tax=Persea americana TaxID=3435 RepID=A0ACC2M1P8_PERAE|nr:hypothetical protein MRB53_016318 [Persea americana]